MTELSETVKRKGKDNNGRKNDKNKVSGKY